MEIPVRCLWMWALHVTLDRMDEFQNGRGPECDINDNENAAASPHSQLK
jgi:hypothetical protein